jgi:hypothetical protein
MLSGSVPSCSAALGFGSEEVGLAAARGRGCGGPEGSLDDCMLGSSGRLSSHAMWLHLRRELRA